jgi:hypothetical protein
MESIVLGEGSGNGPAQDANADKSSIVFADFSLLPDDKRSPELDF